MRRDLVGAIGGGVRVLALTICIAWSSASLAASLAGRPVQDVLAELSRDSSVNFIYNTDLVPPQLRVTAEPEPGDVLGVARRILATHGLALASVGDNAYAVVRDDGHNVPPDGSGLGAARPELAELVVTTSRYALAYGEPEAHEVLSQAVVHSLPSLADEPLRSVQRLPGAATYGLSAQSHIRGGEVDEVLMVLDGLPLYEPFHLKNFLTPVSVFDAAAIESIDVSLGGFAANYGDRMSGVLDISSLQASSTPRTELGLSLYHASALTAGRFADGRGQWLGSARRSNLDLISRAVDFEYGEPEYHDVFGRVSYALSETATLFGSGLMSKDEVRANNGDKTERTAADYRNTYLWGGWEQQWPARLSSRLLVALTDIDNERDGTIDEPSQSVGSVYDHRALQSYLVRLDVSHSAERLFTRFGVEGRHLDAGYHYRSTVTYAPDYPLPGDPASTTTRDLSPNPDGNQFGVYLSSRAQVSDRLITELGLRWDDQTYDDVGGPEQWSPRVNVLYELTPKSRLRAAWGRFWQAQGANELQVEDGIDTFYAPQKADHLILSLEQGLPADLDLRIELYQKDYERVRPHFENLFDPIKLLPELEPDRIEVAPDHSRARGAEILLSRANDGPWSGWLSYAWSRVTDRIGGDDVRRSWDQRHTVIATLRYTQQPWELTLTDTYHSGWPTTSLYLAPDPEGGPDVATIGPRNGTSYRPYNSLDFRVLRRYRLPESDLEAFFELTDVLARRNPCCTEYDVAVQDGVTRIDQDVQHWPRLLPNFGVVWKF